MAADGRFTRSNGHCVLANRAIDCCARWPRLSARNYALAEEGRAVALSAVQPELIG